MKKNYIIPILATLLTTASLMAQPIVRPITPVPTPETLVTAIENNNTVSIAQPKLRSVQNAEEIIYAVEGTKLNYYRTATCWYYDSENSATNMGEKTNETHVVFNGNEVYIKNPFAFFSTQTWIKGTRNGNTITFPNKQPILEQVIDKVTYVYYAELMTVDENSGAYIPLDGDIVMTINEKNEIFYEGAANNAFQWNDIIALTDESGEWFGYGEMVATFTPVPAEEAPVMPAHVTRSTYKMTYQDITKIVEVGIDGNDIYVTNLPDVAPSLTIKGTLQANGDITFENLQYMGFNDIKGYNTYFLAFNSKDQVYPVEATFTYDAINKTYTAINQIILFNTNRSELEYMFIASEPVLELWEETLIAPADPTIQVIEVGDGVERNYSAMMFTVPSIDVNGAYINTENLYYNLLVDGEVITFTKDEYEGLKVDPLTDIPHAYADDWNVMYMSANQRLIYFNGVDFKTAGVQSLYIVGDQIIKSNVVTIENPTLGIEEITNSKPEGKPEYYDLFGRKLNAPQKGINIERYPDGTTRKIIYNE